MKNLPLPTVESLLSCNQCDEKTLLTNVEYNYYAGGTKRYQTCPLCKIVCKYRLVGKEGRDLIDNLIYCKHCNILFGISHLHSLNTKRMLYNGEPDGDPHFAKIISKWKNNVDDIEYEGMIKFDDYHDFIQLKEKNSFEILDTLCGCQLIENKFCSKASYPSTYSCGGFESVHPYTHFNCESLMYPDHGPEGFDLPFPLGGGKVMWAGGYAPGSLQSSGSDTENYYIYKKE